MRGKLNEKLVLALDVSTQPEMDRLMALLWGGDIACIKLGPHAEGITNYIEDVPIPKKEAAPEKKMPVEQPTLPEIHHPNIPVTNPFINPLLRENEAAEITTPDISTEYEFPMPQAEVVEFERYEHQDIIRIIKEKYLYPFVMWDMNYYGPPNLIGLQVERAAKRGADYITVSGACGPSGIAAAVKRKGNAKIIVTTVPPTFDEIECKRVYGAGIKETAIKFATLALAHNADGVMCSAQELSCLNRHPHFSRLTSFVTEVRLAEPVLDDRKRICTPAEALHQGADFLVLDTLLLKPKLTLTALKEILQNMEQTNGVPVQSAS